jgi:uncharacterized protein YdbL (DUF1318 family)
LSHTDVRRQQVENIVGEVLEQRRDAYQRLAIAAGVVSREEVEQLFVRWSVPPS